MNDQKPLDRQRLQTLAKAQLGDQYLFGAKPDAQNLNPQKFDCSGFVHWCYAEVGLAVPEGSWEQYDASNPIGNPEIGDVGFFRHITEPYAIHHVGMLIDEQTVIEARGDPYNKVILRSRDVWEKWKEFTGWRRFIVVSN